VSPDEYEAKEYQCGRWIDHAGQRWRYTRAKGSGQRIAVHLLRRPAEKHQPGAPNLFYLWKNLAGPLFKEGRLQEAEKLQRDTLANQIRVLGPTHLDTLASQGNLAGILNREGQYAEAEKIARQAFEVEILRLGPQHLYTLDTLQQLGISLAYSHRYGEASQLFPDVIAKDSNSGGQGNHFSVWYSFACVAVAANRPDDALRYLREAINRGYKDVDGLTTDDDLKNLRHNLDFQDLITELKRPPTAVKTQ